MKRIHRGMVIGMCLAAVLSLFGGCKAPYVDGPGMERQVWSAFSVSQTSDDNSQNFSYTVKHDETSGEVTVSTDVYDFELGYPVEKSVVLDSETAAALLNYDLMALPDETPSPFEGEILDGTFLHFSVRGQTGLYIEKDAPSETVREILELLAPYINESEGE